MVSRAHPTPTAELRQQWEVAVAKDEQLKAEGADREVQRMAHKRVMLAWAKVQASG